MDVSMELRMITEEDFRKPSHSLQTSQIQKSLRI